MYIYKDSDGDTAIIIAARRGHLTVVTILLDRGADVHAKEKDIHGIYMHVYI
jgi:ankyrin repeat protein